MHILRRELGDDLSTFAEWPTPETPIAPTPETPAAREAEQALLQQNSERVRLRLNRLEAIARRRALRGLTGGKKPHT
jgi:hypothetical protein